MACNESVFTYPNHIIVLYIILFILKACPVIAEWSPWGACSKPCGVGKHSRTRVCVNEIFEGLCFYSTREEKACNLQV